MPEQLLIAEPGPQELLQVAEQGPPGPPGPAGAPGGALLQVTAGANLGGHLAVAYNTAGQLVPASADEIAPALQLVGVTIGAAAAGTPGTVQRQDVLEHAGWAWSTGQPVYLGLGGALVQALPAGALFVLVVGLALGPTRLLINPQPAVILS